jgi:hypothetical protein
MQGHGFPPGFLDASGSFQYLIFLSDLALAIRQQYLNAVVPAIEPGYFFFSFDTQFGLLSLTWVYISEQPKLLPGAYFHVSLEQISRDDEMLDIIIRSISWPDK